MTDTPKFLKVVWENDKPAAWMSDGPMTNKYSMSKYDCENAIAGWEDILKNDSEVVGVPSEEARFQNGIQQFKVALTAIKDAEQNGATKKFNARMGLQGAPNPLTYVEIAGGKIKYVKNGSQSFEIPLHSTQVTFNPKGIAQVVGYGDVVFNSGGRSYEAPNMNNGRELRRFVEAQQSRRQ